MSSGIEVNSAYRGVAASWLGVDINIYGKKGKESDKNNNQGTLSSSVNGHGSSGQSPTKKNKNVNTGTLIKNKIEKKISTTNYWKSQNAFENKRKRPHEVQEEESKSSMVKVKKGKPSATPSTSLNSNIHELNTKLLDPTLSKKAKKRIRKKIAALSNGDT